MRSVLHILPAAAVPLPFLPAMAREALRRAGAALTADCSAIKMFGSAGTVRLTGLASSPGSDCPAIGGVSRACGDESRGAQENVFAGQEPVCGTAGLSVSECFAGERSRQFRKLHTGRAVLKAEQRGRNPGCDRAGMPARPAGAMLRSGPGDER